MSYAKGAALLKCCCLKRLAPRSLRLPLRRKLPGNGRGHSKVRQNHGKRATQLTLRVQPLSQLSGYRGGVCEVCWCSSEIGPQTSVRTQGTDFFPKLPSLVGRLRCSLLPSLSVWSPVGRLSWGDIRERVLAASHLHDAMPGILQNIPENVAPRCGLQPSHPAQAVAGGDMTALNRFGRLSPVTV